MQSYKELRVWQLSMDLVNEIYRLTKMFPKDELFGLTNQIRRAAVSIPSNISEGHGRYGPKDFAHFLQIAFGSSTEVETQLMIAKSQGYISDTDYEKAHDLVDHVCRALSKLIASLRTA